MRAYAIFLLLLTACSVHSPAQSSTAEPSTSAATASSPSSKDKPSSPSIASASAGSNTISITSAAFPPDTDTATYALYQVDAGKACSAAKQLATVSGTSTAATNSGTTTLTLVTALTVNTSICAIETFMDANKKTVGSPADSNVVVVTAADNGWGRVRAYFVGGILIANDSSAFSSAHQFYDLTIEKTWHLPRCYLQDNCAPPGADDLSGGVLKTSGEVTISGGRIKLGSPIEIEGATATTGSALETITVGSDSIKLAAGSSFKLNKATLDGTITQKDGNFTIAIGGKITITVGALPPTPRAAKAAKPAEGATPDTAHHRFSNFLQTPGVTSYFETRLTAIPVVSNSSNTTTPATTPAASTTASIAEAGTATTPTPTNTTAASFLTTQQTANVTVGVYLPFLLSRWTYNNAPNALFIAPLSKTGFNTLTGATSQNVVEPGGSTGTQSFEQIYNYYSYGARIGHMGLTTNEDTAPEIFSYLDVVFGRYSNLESLICHLHSQGGAVVANSQCPTAYANAPDTNDGKALTYDSRKRLYRLDLEGLLKIPNTLFYVGLNANIGQKTFQAEKLDPAFKAPDDIRFLFGTKFDIATLFNKLGVKLP